MTNITRFDPFTSPMNELLNGLFVRPVRFDLDPEAELRMKVDVKQDDKAYTVTADMPGVKKDDIQVDIDGNVVSVQAEVKRETEEKEGARVIRSERYYGKLARSFSLDHEIDRSAVDAKYADGVLTLRLPKKTKASAARIPVH
jgi:HSP20 family protein